MYGIKIKQRKKKKKFTSEAEKSGYNGKNRVRLTRKYILPGKIKEVDAGGYLYQQHWIKLNKNKKNKMKKNKIKRTSS